eukprot:5086518-Pyramimonas_sp.AAC.1
MRRRMIVTVAQCVERGGRARYFRLHVRPDETPMKLCVAHDMYEERDVEVEGREFGDAHRDAG